VINQFGLSCFRRLAGGGYEARTFNFYVFPLPSGQYSRKFVCDAGSLAFLAGCAARRRRPLLPAAARAAALPGQLGAARGPAQGRRAHSTAGAPATPAPSPSLTPPQQRL
jgi:hypothetical protein